MIFEKEETDEITKKMKQKIKKMEQYLKKPLRIRKTNLGYKSWWDREHTEKKKEMKRKARKFGNKKKVERKFTPKDKRQEYKRLCQEKKPRDKTGQKKKQNRLRIQTKYGKI